jgi:hypothetical protein
MANRLKAENTPRPLCFKRLAIDGQRKTGEASVPQD